jgi:hypothetical protein
MEDNFAAHARPRQSPGGAGADYFEVSTGKQRPVNG